MHLELIAKTPDLLKDSSYSIEHVPAPFQDVCWPFTFNILRKKLHTESDPEEHLDI